MQAYLKLTRNEFTVRPVVLTNMAAKLCNSLFMTNSHENEFGLCHDIQICHASSQSRQFAPSPVFASSISLLFQRRTQCRIIRNSCGTLPLFFAAWKAAGQLLEHRHGKQCRCHLKICAVLQVRSKDNATTVENAQ